MRVAHLIPYGVHPYSGLLASAVGGAVALARRGAGVELWCSTQALTGDTRFALGPADVEGVRIRELPEPSSRLSLGVELERELAEFHGQSDLVVHIHGVFSPINNLIARTLDSAYVVSPHGGYAAGTMAYHRLRKLAFLKLFELPMLRRASTVCALTEHEASDIRRIGHAGSLSVVPHGVDPVPSNLDRHRLRAELGLDRSVPLAMYAGRIDVRQKRLDTLIRALPGNPWHVALLGGDFRGGVGRLRELADSVGVSDRVHWPRPRRGRDLFEALSAADAFVLLSRSEGLPMALLEASAVEVPAVVSPEVETATGIGAAGAGIVAAESEVAAALAQVASAGADVRSAWVTATRAYAARFWWDRVAEQHEQMYRGVLSS